MIERVIISGGGTGGHIFPAIAIANEIKKRNPNAVIQFVGALGKMEMEKVPAAGYPIVGLPIVGLQRKLTAKNLLLPFKLLQSLLMARQILKKFNPQVVIGVGGYASGPLLKVATQMKIPALVQEQNSFPGKTNRLLSKQVQAICTAYEGLESVFPKEKITLTGNPVRSEFTQPLPNKATAFAQFPTLDITKKTIFVMGGSLGARTLNESVLQHLESLESENVQVIWQCGKFYINELKEQLNGKNYPIHITDFIADMAAAYSVADVIISRAGALSISELCLIGKPVILVPSPNVAEDHQTKNAMALVNKHAAVLIKDTDSRKEALPKAFELLKNDGESQQLGNNILTLAKANAASDIVDIVEQIMSK